MNNAIKKLNILFIFLLMTPALILPKLTIENGKPTVDYEKCKLPEAQMIQNTAIGGALGGIAGIAIACYGVSPNMPETGTTAMSAGLMATVMALTVGLGEYSKNTTYTACDGLNCNALAAQGKSEGIKAILQSDPHSVKADENGRNAFHYAAAFGQVEALKFLYENFHCSPNARDVEGKTPANIAAECNQPEAVRLLYELGADFSIHDKLDRSVVDIAQNKPEIKKVIDELRAK